MKTEYLVTKREECTYCENGWIVNPLWEAFFETFPQWPEPEAERAYWEERGYRKGPPDEELICGHCGGTAVIETTSNLLDVLIELGVTLP